MLSRIWKRIASWRWWWAIAVSAIGIVSVLVYELRARTRRLTKREEYETVADIVEAARASQVAKREAAAKRAKVAQDSADKRAIRASESAEAARALPPNEREQFARKLREKLRKGGSTIFVVLSALGAAVAPVSAADSLVNPSTMAAGWWMDDEEHAETVAWLAELVELRLAFSDQKRAATELTLALNEEMAAGSVCMASLRASESVVRMQDKRLEAASAWWRRPGVVFGVGFTGGLLLTGAIAIGVSR